MQPAKGSTSGSLGISELGNSSHIYTDQEIFKRSRMNGGSGTLTTNLVEPIASTYYSALSLLSQ